jgi:hypothetical protein
MPEESEIAPPTEGQGKDDAKIYSLYIKPSTRERLSFAKKWLNLNYSETLDLLVGHLIQANVLPEEAIKELKTQGLFKGEDAHGLEMLGIQGRWPECAKLIKDLESTNNLISSQLDELIDCIEDHAEAIIMKTSGNVRL